MELLSIGLDDVLKHNCQLVANGKWTGEELLGPNDPARAKQVVVGQNADGRIEIFYIGLDDVLYHSEQLAPNGKWRGKNPVGPNGPSTAKQVAVGRPRHPHTAQHFGHRASLATM
jgi:hypothetical protein